MIDPAPEANVLRSIDNLRQCHKLARTHPDRCHPLRDACPSTPSASAGELDHIRDVPKLVEALEEIHQWADAYPLSIFPEPDLELCATALKSVGQTLDAVSASNMRHVLKGVGEIAFTALTRPSEGKGHE